ncbi:Fusaric acid resistance protein-like-domain-containing protein [Thelonectria olida]|uniref:Fusaric acid resistance protein-like-domain-containing protein n=1 Tax=Thelonectria olida TaxID=1576542 RepID=A0A9P9AU57_9HYPO|nr:Fusaric acid resistance protein-like-domain-containing protein [Thelonectria olida]
MTTSTDSDHEMPSRLSWEGSSSRGRTVPDFAARVKHRVKNASTQFRAWLDSAQGRQVLKCTFAYTIASLATFVSPLANFLGKPDGKHVVATITVYFHPARSAGSMIEAIIIAIVAVAYAELVSVASMATSVFVGSTMKMVAVAHLLVVVVFIGGGFGFMGWVKQKMSNPLVNVGSTLASLAIIGVVTRENHVVANVFSNDKVAQVFKMLIMGISTTAAVNLLVWPQSARNSLRESMNGVSTSLADILSLIIESVTSASESDLASDKVLASSSAYSTAYSQMMKDLREAKFEHYFLGYETTYYNERSIAGSMEMLAQSLGGLRNAAHTQLTLVTKTKSGLQSPMSDSSQRPQPDMFDLFISSIGPSMMSLGSHLCQVLKKTPFHDAPDSHVNIDDNLRRNLTEALGLFNAARTDALQELYDHIEMADSPEMKLANLEEVAAACGHFSFSLQSVGEEVLKYLDVLDNLNYSNQHRRRSWRWLLWWRAPDLDDRKPLWPSESPEADNLINPMTQLTNTPNLPSVLSEHRNSRALDRPSSAREIPAWLVRKILRLFRKLARDDRKFGLKVGIGAAVWAMFAFIEATRDTYTRWRGEWGLLSFMIVCSMTVGASNTTGWARFLGTIVGCLFSVVNWTLSRGNAFVLIILGWMVSLIIFYFIVVRGKAPLGRITLLAYNVSTLYAYSLSQKANGDADDSEEVGQDPDIVEITKHRAIAVTVGILWGLIVCRIIWPISGRRKFKEGLSVLHLQMGLIWKRGPLAVLFSSQGSKSYLKSGEQVVMQRHATYLESLRQSAASEFDLSGPFPMEAYGRMLRATNRILDGFYAMSLVAYRKGHLTDTEKILLQYTARERAALCDSICQAFEVLASSMILEYPLTDATPSIIVARENLLSKIFQLRKEYSSSSTDEGGGGSSEPASVRVGERDYALLYAYALVTGQVAEELTMLGNDVRALIGGLHEDSRVLQY